MNRWISAFLLFFFISCVLSGSAKAQHRSNCDAEADPGVTEQTTLDRGFPDPSASRQAQNLVFFAAAKGDSSLPHTEASEAPPQAERLIVLWESKEGEKSANLKTEDAESEYDEEVTEETIADPLEPLNRLFFHFNDRLYFWLLKPVATVYKAILPQSVRVGLSNFFSNLTTPVRFGNCLLQGDLDAAGNELARFLYNTSFGILGFFDAAKRDRKISKDDRDLGQTLGKWGMGASFYIEWPFLGPSSLRDSLGTAADFFLDPRTYTGFIYDHPATYLVRPLELVNETSLRIGEYEDLKKMAIDPYIAKRDAYYQYRENKIKKVRKNQKTRQ